MLTNHNQLSQYPGLVRSHHNGVFNSRNQVLNLSTSQQYHQQQQHSQLQQHQQRNFAMGVSVQDLQSRPVQRVSPAVQPTENITPSQSPIPSDLLLKPTSINNPGNNVRRNSGDIAMIEVPLSRYSSVLASAVPTVTADGNALQIKRKDFIASRKRREFIPEQAKDNTYWDKRKKNNEAAKRSREKRRYNDIVVEARAFELTQENTLLREKLNALAERFGITDIESLSVEELRNGPLVKIKREITSSPPPSEEMTSLHEEPAPETVNECVRIDKIMQQTSSHDQFQPNQYCQSQAKQIDSERRVQDKPNSCHQPSTQCSTQISKIPVGSSAPLTIHVPNQYHVDSQTPSRHLQSGTSCKSTSRQQNAVLPVLQREKAVTPSDSIAKLYGIEQRRVPSVTTCDSDNPNSLLPKNFSKSTLSLIKSAEDADLCVTNSRERKNSQCSEDLTCGAKSPPHSAFNETNHKLPHKLRGKTRLNPASPDGIPRESSPVPSVPNSAELSPRALVIDVSCHQRSDAARDISGICTPPSSSDDSLSSSPVILPSGPEEFLKQCQQANVNANMSSKAVIEPYRKMVLAAQKLAMVSNDADSQPKSMNKVCYPEEEYQPWAKKQRTNNDTALHVNGLPDTQHRLTSQTQAPSQTYLQFENSQLRNELKMLSQDVATLKNLIQNKGNNRE